mgnify:CR=1 FL=1
MGKLQTDVYKAVTRGCIDKQTSTAEEIAEHADFKTVNNYINQYVESHHKAIGAIISEPYGTAYVFRWNPEVKKKEVMYCLNSEELKKAMDMASVRQSSTGIFEKYEYMCWIGSDNDYNLYTIKELEEYSHTDEEHDSDTYSDGKTLKDLSFTDFMFKDK